MAKINVYSKILGKNDKKAGENRNLMRGAFCVNIMSSPGAGKTTLLEMTLKDISEKFVTAVIEGDMSTSNDAERIRKHLRHGSVVQIKTENFGGGCHLDAEMVSSALKKLGLPKKKFELIIIENVGNLICPADFNLGEHKKIVMLSVTEGDDKPLKYPVIFKSADLAVISKTDLVRHVKFSVNTAVKNIKRINPGIRVILVSSFKKKGMKQWLDYLKEGITSRKKP